MLQEAQDLRVGDRISVFDVEHRVIKAYHDVFHNEIVLRWEDGKEVSLKPHQHIEVLDRSSLSD